MILRSPKTWLALPALSLLAFSAEPERPLCNAQHLGMLWPAQANSDPNVVGKLMRCGQLTMCTRRSWKYRWDSPVVTLDQLRHKQVSADKNACQVEATAKSSGPGSETGQ